MSRNIYFVSSKIRPRLILISASKEASSTAYFRGILRIYIYALREMHSYSYTHCTKPAFIH